LLSPQSFFTPFNHCNFYLFPPLYIYTINETFIEYAEFFDFLPFLFHPLYVFGVFSKSSTVIIFPRNLLDHCACPPLVITNEEADTGMDRFEAAVKKFFA